MRHTRPHIREERRAQTDLNGAIRQRAYELYLNRRGINGDAVGDWVQAEREIERLQQQELRAREARTRGGTELSSAEGEC